jgi:hypothetical protein
MIINWLLPYGNEINFVVGGGGQPPFSITIFSPYFLPLPVGELRPAQLGRAEKPGVRCGKIAFLSAFNKLSIQEFHFYGLAADGLDKINP